MQKDVDAVFVPDDFGQVQPVQHRFDQIEVAIVRQGLIDHVVLDGGVVIQRLDRNRWFLVGAQAGVGEVVYRGAEHASAMISQIRQHVGATATK